MIAGHLLQMCGSYLLDSSLYLVESDFGNKTYLNIFLKQIVDILLAEHLSSVLKFTKTIETFHRVAMAYPYFILK